MSLDQLINFLNHVMVWIEPSNPIKVEVFQMIQNLKAQRTQGQGQ
jgi:hypothetical protein